MSEGKSKSGYESVRAALLERGYLETSLERVFLGSRHRTGRSLGGMLGAALLAGLIAGPVLGLVLAGSLVIEGRGSVPLWPDAAVYAAVFSPAAGLLVAALEFAVAIAVRLISLRFAELSARKVMLIAGLVVAGGTALYFGAWWATRAEAVRLTDLAALVLLGLGAGVAGRVVSAAALVQTALGTGRVPHLGRPRLLLWLGAAAGTAVIAAALGAGLAKSAAPEGEPVQRRDAAPPRAVMIGWDGLSEELAAGTLRLNVSPWLAELEERSASRRVEGPAGPHDPMAQWTTVATGCAPEVHGLAHTSVTQLAGTLVAAPRGGVARAPLDLLMRLLPTQRRLPRPDSRAVPTLWEITADAARTCVVQWWGTCPAAEPGRTGGYVVSEAALVAAAKRHGLEEAIQPTGLARSRAEAWFDRAHTRAQARLDRDTPLRSARLVALEADLFALEASEELLGDPELAALFIHLPGTDIVRERARHEGLDLHRTLDALEEHVRAVDARLGELFGERELPVTLVALPGRAAPGEHGFSLWPGGTGEGETLTLRDIAPTWLAASGYSVDDRMGGQVDPVLAGPEGARTVPIRTRVSVAPATRPELTLEPERLERLRSLGYVR